MLLGTDSSDTCITTTRKESHGERAVRSAKERRDGGGGAGGSGAGGGGGSDGKPTRVRTVLNEKQLHTLRTCYAANPRPDALMKEQLVEMTSLSPRVIRVWFQNKRCKDKKKAILMKQIQQQEKVSTIFIHFYSSIIFLSFIIVIESIQVLIIPGNLTHLNISNSK